MKFRISGSLWNFFKTTTSFSGLCLFGGLNLNYSKIISDNMLTEFTCQLLPRFYRRTGLQVANPILSHSQESKAAKRPNETSKVWKKLGLQSYSAFLQVERELFLELGIAGKIETKTLRRPGCGTEHYDNEGRIIRADFEGFSLGAFRVCSEVLPNSER